MAQKSAKSESGYTLFELLVVLTVVTILLTTGIPYMRKAVLTSHLKDAIPYLQEVGSMERSYMDGRGEYFQPAEDDEQLLIDTLGVHLQDSSDFCYVVRTTGFISSSDDAPDFEVWAILRDSVYSGGVPGRDQTAGVVGSDVASCVTATNKVQAGGWVDVEGSDIGGEGRVVVYRYPPPASGMDPYTRVGRTISLMWDSGISITDPLL